MILPAECIFRSRRLSVSRKRVETIGVLSVVVADGSASVAGGTVRVVESSGFVEERGIEELA
jgi:hypothetical protein